MLSFRSWVLWVVFWLGVGGLFGSLAQAACKGGPMNPITDISWNCIFPIRIGGIALGGRGPTHDPTDTKDAVCYCNDGAVPRVGIKVSFWEPARVIDTVADPYCMMPFGMTLSSPKHGQLRGGLVNDPNGAGKAFQQMHYYIFPVWKLLNMFLDIPCLEDEGFDVAMLTELLPHWNNDPLGAVINPEAVLFGNLIYGDVSLRGALERLQQLSPDMALNGLIKKIDK